MMIGRLDFWHPSNERLRTWLLTGEPNGVGVHVEQCERCAARLEQLDESEPVLLPDDRSSLRQTLDALLAPPADLSDRVVHGVTARSGVDPELALLAGLFTIGVETARLMIEPDSGQDRPGRTTHDRQTDTHDTQSEEDDR